MNKDMKPCKFIATTIHEYLLNENITNNLQNIISKVGDRYSKKLNKTPQQLNNGDCEDIAYDIIEIIGGETPDTFIMDDGWFWSTEKISKYKTKTSEYWNLDNLIKYGEPPFDWKKLNKLDLNGHVWIYSYGKHYDVETINGVDNFWKLPIYQRQLANLNLIEQELSEGMFNKLKKNIFKQKPNIWTHATYSIDLINYLKSGQDFIGKKEDLSKFNIPIRGSFAIYTNQHSPNFKKGSIFKGFEQHPYLITTELPDDAFQPNWNSKNYDNLNDSQNVGVLKPEYRSSIYFKLWKKNKNNEFELI